MSQIKGLVRRDQRGVSLTETLVAIAILAIITAALVGGLFVSIQGDQVARKRISAEGLARYELEYVKASNNWDSSSWTYTLPGGPYPSWDAAHNTIPSGYTGYTVAVTAVPASGYSGTDMQKVTAAVSYSGSQVISIDMYRTK